MSKEKSDEYWQGYIQKQNEAMEICKICRYRTKFRELEKKLADSTPNSVIREELEKATKKYNKWHTHIGRLRYEGKIELCEELLKKQEILKEGGK